MTDKVTERRTADRRQPQESGIDAKLDDMLNLLSIHITTNDSNMVNIERHITELKDEYFGLMQGHEHKFHHEIQAQEIQEKKDTASDWRKIRANLKEKAIIFIFGALLSYVGALMWFDLADRINKEPLKVQSEQTTQR